MQEKLLFEYWQEAREIIKKARERGTPEFPTGLNFLDDLTGGIGRGEIWVISGRTGSGKTSLALQFARSCAENSEHSILFLSLEMKGWELAARMYSSMSGQNFSDLVHGKADIDPALNETFSKYVNNIDFEILEYGYNFEEVKKAIAEFYKTKSPDIIFLDFIQMIDYKNFQDQRLALVSYIRDLKEMANRMNIAFVIVSQIRRLPSGADYNRPPDLQDLMGSGSIEQTADKVLFIYREIGREDSIKYFINFAKNRQGRTGCLQVNFEGEFYRFKEEVLFTDNKTQKVLDTFGGRVID
jgi:replicative DNA helicase